MAKNDMSDKVANRILKAMAYNRETFKDKVEEHLSGAIIEFYKARLAVKNGQIEWVRHWYTEVHTLVNYSFVSVLLHNIKGFKNRAKAFEQVKADLLKRDKTYRTVATNEVERDYRFKKVNQILTNDDTDDFWEIVERAKLKGGL